MRAIVQRVREARVEISNKVVGEITHGLVSYVCVEDRDTLQSYQWISNKIINLRIFKDEQGNSNNSLLDMRGALLVIPNFTLVAETKKGNRPSFNNNISVNEAEKKFNLFIHTLAQAFPDIQKGEFGENMQVYSIVDGPYNIIIDTPFSNST